MLERIRTAVAFAAEEGIRVAFFGVDSTRADLEFVRAAYESAVEAGAAEVVVVDTLGIATPEAAAFLVNDVAERLDYDDPGALARPRRLRARDCRCRGGRASRGDLGARDGERHGRARRKRRSRRGRARARGAVRHPDATRPRAGTSARAARRRSARERRMPPGKPVTGDNLFTRESGAVAAQFHDPPAIEPYASERRRRDARNRARQEERARLDSHQARRARPRVPGGAARRSCWRRSRSVGNARSAGSSRDVEFRRLVNRKRGRFEY